MPPKYIEVSRGGRWVRVPAIDVGRQTLIADAEGRWLKIASIHDEDWLDREIDNPEACLEALTVMDGRQLHADIFTFTQKVPSTVPKYQYPIEWDSIAAIRLKTFDEWWERLPQETRKNVRRAQKRGIVAKLTAFDDDLIRGIAAVNNEAPLVQGRQSRHYGKTYEQVRRDHESFLDRCDFIGAFRDNVLIGFLKVVYRGDVASVLNIACKVSEYGNRPSNALIAKAVELCIPRGMSHLTYGMFNYGNKHDTSLRQFKIRHGFGEVLMPRFYVPLTAKGRLCMRFGLHRGLLGILPHSVITFGNNVRALVLRVSTG